MQTINMREPQNAANKRNMILNQYDMQQQNQASIRTELQPAPRARSSGVRATDRPQTDGREYIGQKGKATVQGTKIKSLVRNKQFQTCSCKKKKTENYRKLPLECVFI